MADDAFAPNVAALEEVQPEDLASEDIDVRLGAAWVPPEIFSAFIGELMGLYPDEYRTAYLKSQGTWVISPSRTGENRGKTSRLATEVWGTPYYPFLDLLKEVILDRPVVVKVRDPQTGETSVLPEQTAAANSKATELKEKWKDWVWEDAARASRLTRLYNDQFNNIRTTKYEATHYTKNDRGESQLPGMNPAIWLRPHQANAVWQTVSQGRALYAHEVGTGKTFTMVAAAMELRRLGLARKPAIAVPKSIIEGFLREARELYPGAQIITTFGNFEGQERKRTTAKIATGDWDLVILTHDNLDSLPMRPEVVASFIQRELDELEEAILSAKAEDKTKGNRIVKQLEKAKLKLEAWLDEAIKAEKKDDAVFFEETGIDFIFVDEAHKYKSLPVYSARKVKGVPTSRSDRATNMLMRTRWLQEQHGGRGVAFATGTPIANTMVEMYNVQRYLQYPDLEERGIQTFDAWASVFGETVTKMEQTVTGDYAPVQRFARFTNLPELLQISREVMDTRFADDMPESIKRPSKKTELIEIARSEAQSAYMADIKRRAEVIKRKGVDPKDDNYLKLSSDARKMSLDIRLVRAGAADADSKARRVAENVLRIHKEKPNVTQMIFSDLGIHPTSWGFSVYSDIQSRLIQGGIPKEKIINFAELTESTRKTAIERLRKGEAWVAIGSTEKLGQGVNAQDHLYALHHIDAPWVPAYDEQRNGRAWRQGNKNPEIKVYRYVTTQTFDTFMWQLLDAKSKFIKQAMKGGVATRAMKDEDGEELSYAQIMAITSGNPLLIKKVQLDEDVRNLDRLERAYQSQQRRLRQDYALREEGRAARTKLLDAYRDDLAHYEAAKEEPFSITVGDRVFTEREEGARALYEKARATVDNSLKGEGKPVGSYRGFTVSRRQADDVFLHRRGTYWLPLGLDMSREHLALMDSITSILGGLGRRVQSQEKEIADYDRETETIRAEMEKPFKQQGELEAKRQELREVDLSLRPPPQQQPPGAAPEDENDEQVERQAAPTGWTEIEATPLPRVASRWPDAPLVRPGLTLDEAFAEMRFRLRAGGVVEGNRQATLFFQHLQAGPGEPFGMQNTFNGLTFPMQLTGKLVEALRRLAEIDERFTDSQADQLFELAAQIETAGNRAPSGAAMYIDADDTRTDEEVAISRKHERTHGWQLEVGGKTVLVSDEWIKADPDASRIRRALASQHRRYPNEWRTVAVEAASHILSGEWWIAGFDQAEQAAGFVSRYLAEVAREYGAWSLDRLRFAHPAFRETIKEVRRAAKTQEAQGVTGGTEDVGPIARDLSRESQRAPQGRGRDAGAAGADQGRAQGLQERLPQGGPEGGRGSAGGALEVAGAGEEVVFQKSTWGTEEAKDAAQAFGSGVAEILKDIRAIASPMGRGLSGQQAALITRAEAGALARRANQAEAKLKEAREHLNKMPWVDRRAFIYAIETDQVAHLPQPLQKFATLMRDLLDERRDQVQALGTGKLRHFYENYFPHIWEDPFKAAAAIRNYFSKRPFEGRKGFLKQRTVPTTEHGLAMGLEPVTKDPVEMVLLKLREMDRYLLAQHVIREMKDAGLLVRIKATHRLPDGWAKIDDRAFDIVKVLPRQGALVTYGHWIAPEAAANVVNNYLSVGLRRKAWFRGYLGLGNLLNQAQLGFSFFHFLFTSLDALASKLALATHQLVHGRPLKAAGNLLQVIVPVAPITNILQGRKLYKAWHDPGAMGPEWAAIAEAMEAGGGRVKMDDFYATKASEQVLEAIREFRESPNVPDAIKAIFKAPLALLELQAKPLMEYLVPRQKLGVFANLARWELERLGPNATREQIRSTMQKAWDSVDNRMGQMVYDNLFWKKWFKDFLMASVRSVGWNLGTKREVFGAALIDAPKFVSNALVWMGTAGKGRKPPPPPGGRPYKSGAADEWFSGHPVFTHRMAYLVGMTGVGMLVGGFLNYFFTGETPKEIKDWFFPRTGRLDEHGRPERLSLPSYIKDIYHLAKEPGKTLINKLHPGVHTMAEMFANEDYYGVKVYNEDDPPHTKAKDLLWHMVKALEPFTSRAMRVERERGHEGARGALSFIGLTPAPKSLNMTRAEVEAQEFLERRMPPGSRTAEQAARSKERRDMVRSLRLGKNVDEKIIAAREAGRMTQEQAQAIRQDAHETPIEAQFKRLTAEEALKVWGYATPAERDRLRRVMQRKRAALAELPAADSSRLRPEFNRVLER